MLRSFSHHKAFQVVSVKGNYSCNTLCHRTLLAYVSHSSSVISANYFHGYTAWFRGNAYAVYLETGLSLVIVPVGLFGFSQGRNFGFGHHLISLGFSLIAQKFVFLLRYQCEGIWEIT